MDTVEIDLKQEHAATLARAPYPYSALARFFFASMDTLVGAAPTLGKVKLLELFAGVPYQAYDAYHTSLLTRHYRDAGVVARAREVVAWGRAAQDNELWHLLGIQALMTHAGEPDPWYHTAPIPATMLASYRLFIRLLTRVNPRRALRFNGEFEDHAEHSYARFVAEHPEWEQRPLPEGLALLQNHPHLHTWADLFRRISLDERAHSERSFELAQ
jgi:ubiquinol oxidase